METSINQIQISVVIPLYNNSKYIRCAIDSALSQNLNIEVIVINDCSSDNPEIVLDSYLKNEKIVYISLEERHGVSYARNVGIEKARGSYIAFLDADDWWKENKLEKQYDFMKEKNAVLSYTEREIYNENGEKTGKIIKLKEYVFYKELFNYNQITCSSVLVKSEVAREFLMETDNLHEDYYTWLRILKKYKKAYCLNEPLTNYRLRKNSRSSNKIISAIKTYRVYKKMNLNKVDIIKYFIRYSINGIKTYLYYKKGI